jgi:transposase
MKPSSVSRSNGAMSKTVTLTAERDRYHERLKLFQRRLLAARSEMRDARQQDLFFNEAEALAPGADPAQESEPDRTVDIPAHKRIRRGRKPLDPALPRVTVRHGASRPERGRAHLRARRLDARRD